MKVNARKSMLQKQNLYEPSDKSSSKSPYEIDYTPEGKKNNFNTPVKGGQNHIAFASNHQNHYQDSTAYATHRENIQEAIHMSASNFLFKDLDEILDDSDAETPIPLRLKKKDDIPEVLILSDKKAGYLMDDELMASDEDEDDEDICNDFYR